VNGLQATGVPAAHRAPLPGQVFATLLSAWQMSPQLVPAAATVHLPAPSQVPLFPQMGLEGSVGQPPPGGALPAPTLVQVPVTQVLQAAQDETLQQTPATQNWGLGFCLQSAVSSHGPPGPDWPHFPFWQVLGAMHCESRLQPDRHWGSAGSHMIPGQSLLAPAWHAPVPLHSEAAVTTPPVHFAGAHCVPALYLRQPPLPLQVPSFPQLAAP
jgi:hypothetical protein